jgi:hypothetical protein
VNATIVGNWFCRGVNYCPRKGQELQNHNESALKLTFFLILISDVGGAI